MHLRLSSSLATVAVALVTFPLLASPGMAGAVRTCGTQPAGLAAVDAALDQLEDFTIDNVAAPDSSDTFAEMWEAPATLCVSPSTPDSPVTEANDAPSVSADGAGGFAFTASASNPDLQAIRTAPLGRARQDSVPQLRTTVAFDFRQSNGAIGQRLVRFERNDIDLRQESSNRKLTLRVRQRNAVTGAQGTLMSYTVSASLAEQQWHHIELTIDAVEDEVVVRVTPQGESVQTTTVKALTTPGPDFAIAKETAIQVGDLTPGYNVSYAFDHVRAWSAPVFHEDSLWRQPVADAQQLTFDSDGVAHYNGTGHDTRAWELRSQLGLVNNGDTNMAPCAASDPNTPATRTCSAPTISTSAFTSQIYVVPTDAGVTPPRVGTASVQLYVGGNGTTKERKFRPCPSTGPVTAPCTQLQWASSSLRDILASPGVPLPGITGGPVNDGNGNPLTCPALLGRAFLDRNANGRFDGDFSDDGTISANTGCGAEVAAGGGGGDQWDTDAPLSIYQPSSGASTSQLFEFWKFLKAPHPFFHNLAGDLSVSGANAQWGGRMTDVARDNPSGGFEEIASPLEKSNWGATATSLPLAGGMITRADVAAGRIEHAVGLTVPWASDIPLNADGTEYVSGGKRWVWPAKRHDGQDGGRNATSFAGSAPCKWNLRAVGGCIPEGTRFRISGDVDCDQAFAGLSATAKPVARMICEAGQKYGFVVWDRSSGVGLRFERSREGADPWKAELGNPGDFAEAFWADVISGIETIRVGRDDCPVPDGTCTP